MNSIELRRLETVESLHELISVFTEAFETTYHVSDDYLMRMCADKSLCAIGAFDGNRLVGGLVAFELLPIHGNKEMYIYDIAIHPNWQQQGVGTALINHLKDIARTKGVQTLFVEAEAEDDGAVAFIARSMLKRFQ